MLSIEKCKTILQKDGQKYTDEEIKQIRDLLYKMGNLDYLMYHQLKNKSDGKCDSLHKGVHRRAS